MGVTLLWVLCVALIVLGLAGTVLPVLPGTVLVWAGIVLGAWIDDFARVSLPTVGVITVLALLAWGLDYAAGLLGAQRAGASKQALLGAALGTLQDSVGYLAVGGVADVCVLSDQGHWPVTERSLRSQGKSTPFSGYELPGRVLATVVGGHVAFEV